MIGIIGATGEVGQHALSFLKSKAPLCLLVRDPKKLLGLSNHIEVRQFDFTQFHKEAFDGIESLLWILPNQHQTLAFDEQVWLKLASSKRVRYIVKLSVMHVEEDDIFGHRDSERHVIDSGIDYTFLRPNTFMQNFNNYEIKDIKNRHQLRFPAGNGKTSFIDSRDIAEVAATVLLDSTRRHINEAYTLTGSEALSYGDVAELFSRELPFTVKYIDLIDSRSQKDQYKMNHPFYKGLKRDEFSAVLHL